MSSKIGLFWGSDSGVTEEIVKLVVEHIGQDALDVYNVFSVKASDFASYEKLLLGLSTWYDGQLQSDWDIFFEEFKEIDFSGKTVALFGPGDQEGYAEYFVDGLGILAEIILKNGGQIIGHWPIVGYEFEKSKALVPPDNTHFYGLALDEDNQPHQTDERLYAWLDLLKNQGFYGTN